MTNLDSSKGCMIFENKGKDDKHRCTIEVALNNVSSKLIQDCSARRNVMFTNLGIKEEKPEHETEWLGASWDFRVEQIGFHGDTEKDFGATKIEAFLSVESDNQLEVDAAYIISLLNVNGKALMSGNKENSKISCGKPRQWSISCESLSKNPLLIDGLVRFRVDIEFTILTESAIPKTCTPSDLLMRSSSAMFNSPDFSDFKLQSNDGKVFHVQKLILKFRSVVFAAMFSHKLKETETGECVISDVDGKTLEALLKFLYGFNEWKPQLAEKLIVAAGKYQILDLVDGCTQEIITQLTARNAARLLKLADQISVTELKQAALKFIVGNWDGFNEAGGFIELSGNVGLLQELKDFPGQHRKSKKQKTSA